jgi:molybdenum cofactor synthesis domain-containing protein
MLDSAGPAVAELLTTRLQARIAWNRTIPDDADLIAEVLTDLCDRRVDLVITVGGTGISGRDVTPEATRRVIDRELPGLAEAMRSYSAKHSPHAALSRAVTGVRREALIVNLPGSQKAAVENLNAILPALPHAVEMLRNQVAHPESDKGRLVMPKAEQDLEPEPLSLNDFV